jgi:hypothetical protein
MSLTIGPDMGTTDGVFVGVAASVAPARSGVNN